MVGANIPLDIYLNPNETIRFFVTPHMTVNEFKEMIVAENPVFESFRLKDLGQTEMKPEELIMPFLQYNQAVFWFGIKKISYIFDPLNLSLNYFECDLNGEHGSLKEIPVSTHYTLSLYNRVLLQNLEKKFPGASSFKAIDVIEALPSALENLEIKATTLVKDEKSKLDLVNRANLENIQNHLTIEKKINKSSLLPAKVALALTSVQGAILYHITYNLYGWDVGEPISYLLALSLEMVGFYFALNKYGEFGVEHFYEKRKNKLYTEEAHKKCSNYEIEKEKEHKTMLRMSKIFRYIENIKV